MDNGMIDSAVIKILLKQSVEEVFSMMLSIKVLESENHHNVDGFQESFLSATIGFAGDWTGFVSLRSCETFSSELTSHLLMTPEDKLDRAEIRDAMGEIINMVGGRFKALFGEKFNNNVEAFKMSLPSVVLGSDYQIYAIGSDDIEEVILTANTTEFAMGAALKRDPRM